MLFTQFSFINARAKNLYETWLLFCHEREKSEAPIAKWFSKDKNYAAHAAPINVSKELNLYFWDKISNGVILCSATVRSLGKFSNFHRKTGLVDNESTTDIAIEPFFDYTKSVYMSHK